MSSKERFTEPVDVYTEDEWNEGDDAEQEWSAARVVRPYESNIIVKRETPRPGGQ